MSTAHTDSAARTPVAPRVRLPEAAPAISTEARVSLNVRYLLWRAPVPRARWASTLQQILLGVEHIPVQELLRHGTADPAVIHVLARSFNVEADVLKSFDLLAAAARVDVWRENLKCLLELQPRGAKKRIASYLRIDQGTVSRWLAGARPSRATQQLLKNYFVLDRDTELLKDPLFLLPDPPTPEQRKRWLAARILDLSQTELQELYPALKRILTRPH